MQSIPMYLLAALASLCLFGCSGRTAVSEDIPTPTVSSVEEGAAMTADTKIADVIADPVFEGYGRLLFPVQNDRLLIPVGRLGRGADGGLRRGQPAPARYGGHVVRRTQRIQPQRRTAHLRLCGGQRRHRQLADHGAAH